jgi:hypothetical protein
VNRNVQRTKNALARKPTFDQPQYWSRPCWWWRCVFVSLQDSDCIFELI